MWTVAHMQLTSDTKILEKAAFLKAIRALDEMPLRHQRYQDEPWNSQGVRYVPVDNYLVFYLLNEKQSTVNIIRIMYKGRDIRAQLNDAENL